MRERTKSNKKLLIGLSAGFVMLMLTASAGLYMADRPDVRVETRNVPSGPDYSLEEVGTDELNVPISQVENRLVEDMIVEANVSELNLNPNNNEVPEPATLAVLAAGGVMMLRRRRRK